MQSCSFERLGESRVIKSVFPWMVEQGACHEPSLRATNHARIEIEGVNGVRTGLFIKSFSALFSNIDRCSAPPQVLPRKSPISPLKVAGSFTARRGSMRRSRACKLLEADERTNAK